MAFRAACELTMEDDTWLGPGIDDRAVIWAFLMNHHQSAGTGEIFALGDG